MKRTIIAGIIAGLVAVVGATSAYASGSSHHNNNTTNNNYDNSTTNNTTHNQGGQGGDGTGVGIGVGIGQGGNAHANGGTALSGSNSSSESVSGAVAGAGASSDANSLSGAVSGSGGNTLSVINEAPDIPVASAADISLVATGDCMGSSGGSVQTMGFGGGFSSTYVDEGCDLRKSAAMTAMFTGASGGITMLCQNDARYAKVFARILEPIVFEELCGELSEEHKAVPVKTIASKNEVRQCYPGEEPGHGINCKK